MISKTTPVATTIDPLEKEEAPHVLEELWSGNELLENPSEAFEYFVSQQSGDKLKLHIIMKRFKDMGSTRSF